MNAKIVAALAVMIAALGFVSLAEDSDADQTINATWSVGQTLTNYSTIDGTRDLSGSVPGVTFSLSGGFVIANGSPTTPGSYTVTAVYDDGEYLDYNTLNVTVTGAPPVTYSFNLYYSANGGSGAPSTQYYSSSSSSPHYFTVSNTQPVRSGYTFLGWSTSSSAASASYYGGDTISVAANGSKTLYAVWQLNVSYTATLAYAANGSNVAGMPPNQTYTSSSTSSVDFLVTSTVPTREGFYFVGWNTDPTDPGATIDAGNTVAVSYNGTVTLYAIWKAISPADFTLNWSVNIPVSNAQLFAATQDLVGSVPGVTLTLEDGWVIANGTPTTAGSYPITAKYVDGTGWEIITAIANVDLNLLTITFDTDTPGWGTIQPVTTIDVPYGSVISIADNVLTVNNVNFTAVPSASNATYSYGFDSWSAENGDVITVDTDISATFTRTALLDAVHWSNGMFNGSVSFLFSWPTDSNQAHNMNMKLYDGTVNADLTTSWVDSGYELNISATYPNTNFAIEILKDNVSVYSKTASAGKWAMYELTIDTDNGMVTMTPVSTFTSFMDYTLLESQRKVIFDFSTVVMNKAVTVIDHDDTGAGAHVRFSVTDTMVFLNTYGIVMNNPSINVYNHFPQYEKVRVNFYAFALYGNSITINGQTYSVQDGKVTVNYIVDDDRQNVLPSVDPEKEVRSRTMPLTNISVTWDGSHVILTFINDRFTIDLGEYTQGNETVSFNGLWYFTATIYEPESSTAKELGPWKALPDMSKDQMLIIFLAAITLIGSAAYIKLDGTLIDVMIMVMAAVVGFFMLG